MNRMQQLAVVGLLALAFTGDGIHPNDAGYQAMADAVIAALP